VSEDLLEAETIQSTCKMRASDPWIAHYISQFTMLSCTGGSLKTVF